MNLIRNIWKKYSKILPDTLYICLEFRKHMGCFPDLKNPKTFNEKLQWLKLYDRNEIYTSLVDKNEVKKVIGNIIGTEYIIPTIGGWEEFDEIDFDKLPNRFVLKCTHDSAGLVIVKNKDLINKKEIKEKMQKCLKINYFYGGREWPYKNVKPRIIAEEYLEDESTKELRDYKFFCFNGEVKCFKIDFDRQNNHRANYYNLKRELLPFGEVSCPPDPEKNLDIPLNFDEMVRIAGILSKETIFSRVDLYNVNNQIYFGEITFFPDSGWGVIEPKEWDTEMGKWIKLEQ